MIMSQGGDSIDRFLNAWVQENKKKLINSGINLDACSVSVLATEYDNPYAAIFFEIKNTKATDGKFEEIKYLAAFEQIDSSTRYEYIGSSSIHRQFGDLCIFRAAQENGSEGEAVIFFAGDNSEIKGDSYYFECDGKNYTHPLSNTYVLDILSLLPVNSLTLHNKAILDQSGNVILNYF